MALTNAEKQANFREKKSENLESLTAAFIELSKKHEELHVQLAAATAKNHVLELKLAKLAAKTK